MRKHVSIFFVSVSSVLVAISLCIPYIASAQTASSTATSTATSKLSSTSSLDLPMAFTAFTLLTQEKKDLTKPETTPEKQAVLDLLARRPIDTPNIFTLFAWWVQDSIISGVPSNTIVLILMLPLLTTIVAFTRVIVGLPSLEMLVPIALAYALVALGLVLGGVILSTILIAALLSRMLLKRVRIMYYPKRSLSMLFLSLLVFAALTVSIKFGLGNIEAVSIFPILVLALLGDSLVSIQLHKSMKEALRITFVTIFIGILGFALATTTMVRETLVLYPELVFLLIPINVIMGRYFGLRISELFRFRSFNAYGGE